MAASPGLECRKKSTFSPSGEGRQYTTESVSIRLIDTSMEGEHLTKESSSDGGSSDIMLQFHQDVVEKMRKNKEISQQARERKKWTLASELRQLTQGVNVKFDKASKCLTII